MKFYNRTKITVPKLNQDLYSGKVAHMLLAYLTNIT